MGRKIDILSSWDQFYIRSRCEYLNQAAKANSCDTETRRSKGVNPSKDNRVYDNNASVPDNMGKSDDMSLSTPDPSDTTEEWTYVSPTARKLEKKVKAIDEHEPLIDTTATLEKRSKKTGRLQKRLEIRQQKAASRAKATSLLDLPVELVQESFGYLRPSDLFRLSQVNRALYHIIQENKNAVAREIIRRRYWILSQCFPLPVPFENVDSSAHPALLSDSRQDMIQIHKKPYQHVKGIDPLTVCTCMNCVFAWNNLCLILDLAHWQKNLDRREPIPMIPRGSYPEWNRNLLDANAAIVEKAMEGQSLYYAVILEKHLNTTMSTLSRTFRGKKTVHPRRLYHFTNADAQKETDEFLERDGPPSYEFPWHRDNYYALEAYIPNRKWSKEHGKWVYYAHDLHERDLQWVKDRFTPTEITQRWSQLRTSRHRAENAEQDRDKYIFNLVGIRGDKTS